jgi:hypothetical protein
MTSHLLACSSASSLQELETFSAQLEVVVNWSEELKRLVPVK